MSDLPDMMDSGFFVRTSCGGTGIGENSTPLAIGRSETFWLVASAMPIGRFSWDVAGVVERSIDRGEA